MNEIQIFKNPQFCEVRAVTIDNEPWFVGRGHQYFINLPLKKEKTP